MNSPNPPLGESQEPDTLMAAPEAATPSWEHEPDMRFDLFIAKCLAHADATGCTAERRLAAGVRSVFTEWRDKREFALTAGSNEMAVQTDALG
ncbi:hypothetical protein [Streptomyces sp. XD-27]|uniref:hypothetical protein n=1 Tax=Streptomyces sp. XD-27 TaxID=3062779 RepID=UPI0026F41162|nr:hypothetical protein [Streptomyces sp. XD-27]WKX70203.1 hypothetical protein Q3Y56_09980 [Streptomyces sp. XD-27]WKX73599.1 hypothetical protein Q3Y56_30230 [Streptomyces sp. XD-27]